MDRPTPPTDAAIRTVTANGLEFAYLEAGPDRRAPGPVPARVPRHRPHLAPPAPPPGRRRLPRRRPVPAGLRARPRCPPTVATTPGPWPSTPAPSTRPSVAAATPCIIGHDWGALAHLPGRGPRARPLAQGGHRWPCRRRRRSASGSSTTTSSGAAGTSSSSRPRWPSCAVGLDDHAFIDRLWADWSPGYDGSWDVARVKEALGDRGQPVRRHRLLPGHVRRPAGRPGGGRRPGRRRDASPPSRPSTSTVPTTAAWASTSSGR